MVTVMTMARAPATILVYVGLDRLGDGLMKLPFIRALRAAFPQSHITWLAGKGRSSFTGPLRPLSEGLIDEIIDDAGIGSNPRELFAVPLPQRRFDLVIDTQRRLLTTLIVRRIRADRFLSAAAGYAFSDVRPALRNVCKPASLSRQLLDLVELASGRTQERPIATALPEPLRARAAALLPDMPRYVGLAPGAGGRIKCWPLERFASVAHHVVAQGGVPVFLLGPEEAELKAVLTAQLPTALFPLQAIGDDPTPALTIALAGRLSAAVANDSGCGHLLAAGGTKLVSLFGPTPAAKFAPDAAHAIIIAAQDFGSSAMTAIPVAAVTRALDEILRPVTALLPASVEPAFAGAAPA
jgi:ADP-heptose:LPS heptosyltransferase